MSRNLISKIPSLLFAEVDNISLVFLRVAFGLLMFAQVCLHFAKGHVKDFWIDAKHHFTYPGFEWVQPFPGFWMEFFVFSLALAAILIALGLFYKTSILYFFLGYSYLFLIDQCYYQNHYYLIILFSFILLFFNGGSRFSLDSRFHPKNRRTTTPQWILLLLRFQVAVVYIYAGIAKIDADWINALPAIANLGQWAQIPVIGGIAGKMWFAYFVSYGGLVFDLLIVPALIWRRTRAIAWVAVIGFHSMNSLMFDIGVFPWFAIAMTTVFLPPIWPNHFLPKRFRTSNAEQNPVQTDLKPLQKTALISLITIYTLVQLLVPLRQHLYPGNPSWTDQGQIFAWRMMLRSKHCNKVKIVAFNRDTEEEIPINPFVHYKQYQLRDLLTSPRLSPQIGQHLASHAARLSESKNIGIRAELWVSLNSRNPRLLIDPERDLTQIPKGADPSTWFYHFESAPIYQPDKEK